jgi:hypothetical protein
LVAACALAVGISGCIDYLSVEGGASMPVVLGVVLAGADSVFVLVGRAGPGTATGPEHDATLTLGSRWGSVPMVESDESPAVCGSEWDFSCYVAALPGPLEPGQTLTLVGTLFSGAKVEAATTVPAVPGVRVSGHAGGGTVRWVERFDTALLIEVPAGDGRIALHDSIVPATWWRDGERRVCPARVTSPPWNFDLRALSTFTPPYLYLAGPECDGVPVVDWDSLEAPMSFLGYDANATRWYGQRGVFWPDEGDGGGIEGALGVFGSATPVDFLLHITARQAAP